MGQKECLAAIVVQPIIEVIFFVVHFLLFFFCDQPRYDADVLGLCHDNFFPLFVEMILTPAKGVLVIAQCLESP
jgi:hypothetical protein